MKDDKDNVPAVDDFQLAPKSAPPWRAIVLTLAFGVLIGIGWVSFKAMNDLVSADQWEKHTYLVIQELDRLLSALKDAETGNRGYLITGDEHYLKPYHAALNEVGRHLDALRRLTADNPVQKERLVEVATLTRTRLEFLKQGIDLRRKQSFSAAREMVMSGKGQSSMDSIRQLVAVAEAEEQRLLEERQQEKAARVKKTVWALSLAGIGSSGLLLVIFFLLRREIAERQRVANELQRQQVNLEYLIQARTVALRQSEARLRTLIEHAPAALAMFDRDMRYLAASRRWREDYSLGGADILGLSHYEALPEIPEVWKEAHRRGLAGEVLSAEADHFERADGTVQWVSWEIRPWQDDAGTVGGIVIFAEDVTERMKAVEALRRSREMLALITDAAPALISYIDAECHYRLANRGYQRWFGLPPEQIVGQPARQVLGEAAWEKVRPWMERALAGEAVSYEQELPYREGGPRWVVAHYIPDKDEAGRVRGFVVLVTDISASKEAEAEIRRMNVELEVRVEARTAELQEANRELESFAYAVSHDLRAPLRAVGGFAQMLATNYGDKLDEPGHQYLDHVITGAQRMGALIDGLLQLARSARGDFVRQRVDLSALAQRILAELATTDPDRRVRCEIEAGLEAEGDPRMLESLMRNLLDNAWKYTGQKADADIRLYLDRSTDPPRYCITDNGAGFDMALAGQLFQPFRRLHRQSEFGGIGIGLVTVQRIVHRHGGEITAQAKPGEGASFCFTLSCGTTLPEASWGRKGAP